MIEFVRGKLAAKAPAEAVVDVHGVAFGLRISLTTFDQLPSVGSEVTLWTRLHVREEQFELYGFAAREERWVFEELIGVNGVGPKLALTLLSGLPADKLRETIGGGDAARLKTVRGIGAKIADRIVLELGKKFSGATADFVPSVTSGGSVLLQVRQALQALGLTPAEIDKSLDAARAQNIESVEEIIKFSLRKA
ncbi:MAG: Holliday junction branch migration protein RuvA [bacterium]|nr:Holliday junction branch migration protein RuvA [bacterium]MBK8130584.1 Holliday junction branch migration protein RuvA [bacterium]